MTNFLLVVAAKAGIHTARSLNLADEVDALFSD